MPGAVVAIGGGSSRATTIDVVGGVVEAIVKAGVERMEVPAQPPSAGSPRDLADTIVARMDGEVFPADRDLARDTSRRLDQWTRTVTKARSPLVVKLEAPGAQGLWMASVYTRVGPGKLVPIDTALKTGEARSVIAPEWARLERSFPALGRASMQRRGQVVLSQAEAWEFMTETGPMLASIGFEVRAPELSRRSARPTLHLLTEARAGSKVGAHQLSNVSWSVLFDDIELTAADIARLAAQARPLVESRGRWVAIDRVDLEQAAAALAEREKITQLTGAEILRHSVGLDGAGLAGGVVVHGDSWAKDIVNRAHESTTILDTSPEGFAGSLRSYQAEALAWIGFLAASELGGCLALDMGLGKTPTVLAHLARTAGEGVALVIAPAAVVGNWAAEAARFTPGLKVVVHHGADRASADEFPDEIAGANLVITTYATAVRDIEALSDTRWTTLVLDEAQAIKNPASDTAQQLRRLEARTRLALTGTPIENGLGDLWAILDFTNPGLVGSRPAFIAQMSGDGEAALRALNGILLFRRTKTEPEVAAELPDKIDELDHCTMTAEQIGLYQAVLDDLVAKAADPVAKPGQGAILAAITALKQICNHPAAYSDDGQPLAGRSGKLARLEEIVESVFAAGERVLIFTHFAQWGRRLAVHLSEVTGLDIHCYDGDLTRTARDRMVSEFQNGEGPGALVLSLKAGGTGLNLTSANHVVLYDRWWNPAVEDQARDRAWRIGQSRTVISHRLVCPGTIDERVEEVVQARGTSPNWSCRAPARSPTWTPTSSASRSACAPTNCSPRTDNDPAPTTQRPAAATTTIQSTGGARHLAHPGRSAPHPADRGGRRSRRLAEVARRASPVRAHRCEPLLPTRHREVGRHRRRASPQRGSVGRPFSVMEPALAGGHGAGGNHVDTGAEYVGKDHLSDHYRSLHPYPHQGPTHVVHQQFGHLVGGLHRQAGPQGTIYGNSRGHQAARVDVLLLGELLALLAGVAADLDDLPVVGFVELQPAAERAADAQIGVGGPVVALGGHGSITSTSRESPWKLSKKAGRNFRLTISAGTT